MTWNFFSEKGTDNSSPYIYSLVEQASGISKQLIDAALNGDASAQAAVTQWADYQKVRAQNAAVVYGALTEGTDATATVSEEESKFLASARESLTRIANAWSSNRIADQETKQNLEIISRRTANALQLGTIAHQKAVATLGLQHQANIKILDITAAAQARRISDSVTKEQIKALPSGSTLLKLGQRLGHWLNRIVEG